MSFTGNYSCNTLRSGLANGTINFATGTFKMALYTNLATLDASTSAYTSSGEATGGNYVAGGQVITATTGTDATSFGSTTFINFSSPSWTGSITAQVVGLTIGGNSFAISWKQILVSIISVPFAILIAQLPLKSLKWFAHRSLGIAILFMLLLIPFGRDVNGNTNWVSAGPFDFQPSEVAKVFLILWSAYVIENNFGDARKITIRLTIGFAMVLAIVLNGGDLGSAVVIGLVLATLIYLAGAESKYIAGIAIAGIVGVAGLVAMQPYRIARFAAFIHPFAEDVYKNAGWQPAHS